MIKKILNINLLFVILILLIGCGKKYNIIYDVNGGVMPEEYKEEFKVKDNYRLPIPSKEGFFFAGWKENDVYVEKLEKKNYTLKAEWIENIDYNYINDFEIFDQEEADYLVYFMRPGCSWCDKIKDEILRYQYKCNTKQFSKNIKLYVVDLRKDGKKSSIFRSYTGENGEGDGLFISGAKRWDDLYIPTTPVLINISTNFSERKASLLYYGYTGIYNCLYQYINDEKDYSKKIIPYELNYELNGGTFEEDYIKKFYSASTVILPIPSLEGYTFLGWYENNKRVDLLENRSYTLSASWKQTMDKLTVKKEEIFKKENEYFVLFIKNSSNILEYITLINHYNTYASEYGYPYIYVIDLNDCKEIYRTYDEENKNYVDEATEWNQLYISERYTLIKLSNELNGKKASFITFGKEEVKDYLNDNFMFFMK